jgi:hypothetical protein
VFPAAMTPMNGRSAGVEVSRDIAFLFIYLLFLSLFITNGGNIHMVKGKFQVLIAR